MNPLRFQVVVIGSGFAGSLIAMIAHRLGLTTALLERGRHPRFAIGESSTPLANLLLEELAAEYDLPFLRPLCKWGVWQERTPQLACGLKRGFTFYHHELGQPFQPDPNRERQLLVGASPNEAVADTHWYRPDFDHYLAQHAQSLGVVYLDEVELKDIREEPGGMRFSGERQGKPLDLGAEFVIDATGPRGCLHQALKLPSESFDSFPATQALFTHFAGVQELPACFGTGSALPPYPPEQAAVHHVFAGGWIWVLKFNNGLTSAGVAATDALADRVRFREGEPAWRRLLEELPSLAESFSMARLVAPFVHQPRVAFQSRMVAGEHWALMPSAAGVIDPLLSTGFPLTLLGVARLGRLLKDLGKRDVFTTGLDDYARLTTLELQTTARLVGALYATLDRFELFKELSLLYFAAASFSEAARRLGKTRLADAFLLANHPRFPAQLRQICALAAGPISRAQNTKLRRRIHEAIEPFDIAGLTDPARHPWYPANPSDLFRTAAKLDATEAEITAMLNRCGLVGESTT